MAPVEKETVIIYNEEWQTAQVRTYNRKLKRILHEIDSENPGLIVISDIGYLTAAFIPKNLICIRKPRKKRENKSENMEESR